MGLGEDGHDPFRYSSLPTIFPPQKASPTQRRTDRSDEALG